MTTSNRITRNFTLDELMASATAKAYGIPNAPDYQATICLTTLCIKILQPLRDAMQEPIKIGSGYRCTILNQKVGGVKNSQHTKGMAVDLCIDGDVKKGQRWYKWITENCEFDQCIWEKNPKTGNYWVHVSYNPLGTNRMQAIPYLEKR